MNNDVNAVMALNSIFIMRLSEVTGHRKVIIGPYQQVDDSGSEDGQ